jgi:hypothetical protein
MSIETEAAPSSEKDDGADASGENGSGSYVLPLVHTKVPSTVVDTGFWGGLGLAVVTGVVDPPLGILVGAGVLIARHKTRRDDG